MRRLRSKRHGSGEHEDTEARQSLRFAWPSLTDARWIVGVLLLVVGVLGTLRTVAALDDSVEVWASKRALTPGHRVEAGDLVRTRVRLAGDRAYLRGNERPVGGVVQRPVEAGELLPRAAVGSASTVDVRSVSVDLAKGQADLVRAGDHVEVWVASKVSDAGSASYAKPTKLVDRALVSRVGSRSGGVVSVADGQPVEVLVPKSALPDVIDAVNSQARITLVPVATGAHA